MSAYITTPLGEVWVVWMLNNRPKTKFCFGSVLVYNSDTKCNVSSRKNLRHTHLHAQYTLLTGLFSLSVAECLVSECLNKLYTLGQKHCILIKSCALMDC